MKHIIIICEGQTEKEFCKDVLKPHFSRLNISIYTPLIKLTGGGIVHWHHLKKQIENHLLQENTFYVTTLIDYYGIKDTYNYPKWEMSKLISDTSLRMTTIEQAMKANLHERIRFRFIPYIQLHEFEGLLFNNIQVFKEQIPIEEFNNIELLEETITLNANPELINNGRLTAPSKRLARLIKGYHKIVYGSIIAEAIGLDKIRAKSPRFNEWITQLERI